MTITQASLGGHAGFDLSGVTLSVSGREIIAPLVLRLPADRVIGILGPNGSGKTSLMRMLGRQIKPTAGTITLSGEALEQFGTRAFARLVAYMPQTTPTSVGMTVRELAALGRFPWHGAFGRYSEDDRNKVEQALEAVHLQPLADRIVDSLSGGERQRAWIAMLLAQDARCLLLDEPTSALDVVHQVETLALLRGLNETRGLGSIAILHDINMAARFCHSILAMKDGKVIAYGPTEDIIRPAVLADIFGLPTGILPHPVTGRPIVYML